MRDFTGVSGASGGDAVNGTRWTPEVGNSIVHEIENAITDPDGGDEALNPADDTQLLRAIQRIAALASGSQRQKGTYTNGGSGISQGTYFVAFPVAFADTNYTLSITPWNAGGGNLNDSWCQYATKYVGGFTLVVQWSGGGSTTSFLDGCDWIAEHN